VVIELADYILRRPGPLRALNLGCPNYFCAPHNAGTVRTARQARHGRVHQCSLLLYMYMYVYMCMLPLFIYHCVSYRYIALRCCVTVLH
jgi:hypothetical protein